jgi:hypothetical protein
MEVKPKSVKLVNFEEELLPTGRKLLHCMFENRYGSGFQYKWTAPWREKGGEHGVERLFLKCLEIEEWNDFDGVWSEELRRASKEVPSLEEMVLPVKVKISGVAEDARKDEEGTQEYLKIYVDILTDKETVMKDSEYGEVYIRVGPVRMAWDSLSFDLVSLEKIMALSKTIQQVIVSVCQDGSDYADVEGVRFWVSIEKTADKGEYQVISREIASCIRRFIRVRLSEYKAIKRGFEEN